MFNNKLKKYISNNFIIIYLVVIILALIIIIVYKNVNKGITQEQTQPNTVSYVDPANHFTVSIPSNWTRTSDFGGKKTGIGTANEQTTRIEVTNISEGNTGINISVVERAANCENAVRPNSKFAGLPAYYDSNHYAWTINTTDSTILVGYYYPGAGVYHRRIKNMAPVTDAEKETSQKIIGGILSTLKLSNSLPLQCQ